MSNSSSQKKINLKFKPFELNKILLKPLNGTDTNNFGILVYIKISKRVRSKSIIAVNGEYYIK